jgi:hypothetical protein
MKWLIINTEAFSPAGIKGRNEVSFDQLPRVVQLFLRAFPYPFIILDEASTIKTTTAVPEKKKSVRTRLIKLLSGFGERCILTATLMSKSPLNVVDPYNFLQKDYFPESMYELAERYCIMVPLRTRRGRRVVIWEDLYTDLRNWMKRSWIAGGRGVLEKAMEQAQEEYGISREKLEWIIRHKKYSPFIRQQELIARLAPCTMFVKREDIFDITFDTFVKEPILRPVSPPRAARNLANELITLGFTDRYTLGRAEALDLLLRLQDLCNGFEPVEGERDGKREITCRPLPENPKLEALFDLLGEIDLAGNQVVIWCSRSSLLLAAAGELEVQGIPFVMYHGGVTDQEKADAEASFMRGESRVFLANQASGAYGLNCLGRASYGIYISLDNSAERYYQSLHRLLRGELTAPKFCYIIYVEKSVEERQIRSLLRGQDLIGARNDKEVFSFKE